MQKSISLLFIVVVLFSFLTSCTDTESAKRKEATKKAMNMDYIRHAGDVKGMEDAR